MVVMPSSVQRAAVEIVSAHSHADECIALAGDNSVKSTCKERDKTPEHNDQGSNQVPDIPESFPDIAENPITFDCCDIA
jgi:hypothetical protein